MQEKGGGTQVSTLGKKITPLLPNWVLAVPTTTDAASDTRWFLGGFYLFRTGVKNLFDDELLWFSWLSFQLKKRNPLMLCHMGSLAWDIDITQLLTTLSSRFIVQNGFLSFKTNMQG